MFVLKAVQEGVSRLDKWAHSHRISPSVRDAIVEGDANKLERLVASGYRVDYKFSDGSNSYMCQAAALGHIECARVLLTNGADVEATHPAQYRRYDQRYTPIDLAIHNGYVDFAEFLFQERPDLVSEQTLTLAAERGCIDFSLLFLKIREFL